MVKKTLQQSLTLVLFICSLHCAVEAQTLDQRASELSQQIARNMETGQKRRIAVLEFTDLQGQVTNFGRYLSEEFSSPFDPHGKIAPIVRHVPVIYAEQEPALLSLLNDQRISLTNTKSFRFAALRVSDFCE